MIDLAPAHLATVRRLLVAHVPECEVRAFGSRVAWTAKSYSDLDLALVGSEKLAPSRLRRLREAFEESNLPIRVDLLDWHAISESFQKVILNQYEVIQQPGPEKSAARSSAVRTTWRHIALADVVDVKHGYAFPGESIRDEPPGDILVTPGNFAVGGGFKSDKFKYFDGPVPEDYVLHEGDLIVTMTDLSKQADTLGYPALVPKPRGPRFLHNQRIGKILIKPGAELDQRFLFYLLRTAEYRDEVLASATGTTVKHTSPSRILAYKAMIPPVPEQKTIAAVLGALDDKIELNRRMNATLEAMARALFQSWFVDFDPVRAKLDGRKPTGLDAATAALFPSHFDHKAEGVVPTGWTRKHWGDIATLEYGKSIRNYRESGAKYRVFGTNGPIGFHDEALCKSAGIAIGRKGAYRGVHYSPEPFFVIDTAFYLKPNVPLDLKWAYYELLRFDINNMDSGSAIPSTSRDDFYGIPVIVPPHEIQSAFGAIIDRWFAKIFSNNEESRTLTMLLDSLLPQLLRGTLRINNLIGLHHD